MKQIDARGLSCPQPVILVRKALSALTGTEKLEVLLDSVVARNNVLRTAASEGFSAQAKEEGDEFKIIINRP